MIKKIIIITIMAVVLGTSGFLLISDGEASKDDGPKTVEVIRGTIVDKALAVGQIDPKKEVSVKSKIGGLVRKIYVEIGDIVKAGDPLFDIAPDPTPLEFAEAKRQVELAQVTFANSKREYDRSETLKNKNLISNQEFEAKQASYDEYELRLKLAREKLALIESGSTMIADRAIDNIIKSPTNGTILRVNVEEGDPVVPLTSFQAGTELMQLAYMKNLVFKGNVDEIDVGKLREGMEAEIEIGALPDSKIYGIVYKISPKAHTDDGATMFEVEVSITDLAGQQLRAGYSANASVIIRKQENVLIVPERLVKIEDSVSTVQLLDSLGQTTTIEIATGLSDGINIEVISGISEGDLIVEPPPREITAD